MTTTTDVFVVSDFNAELLSRYLSADRSKPACKAVTAPYGQVFQSLTSEPPAGKGTVAVIWTRPEGVVPDYQSLLDAEALSAEAILAGVDTFAASIKAFAAKCRLVLVATFVPSRNSRGLGMLDWGGQGEAYWLARMNIRLAEALNGVKGVFILDAQRWLDNAPRARDAKYWYSTKSPFTETLYQAAARDVKAALRGATGQSRKLIVVDLDNTMWGGVVGDDGWQNLRLGGHDHVGEAFADFQRALKTLSRRGIAIGVVSKNDESTALEAIDNHPEMVVGRGDLAGWRINWNDKAQNIVELVQDLNLGLQSVVFIDDNPTERGRVKEALPEVLVPDWPQDPARYADALRQLDCFDQIAITAEDRARTRMYVEDRERKEGAVSFASMDDWLKSLDVRIGAASLSDENLKRSIQLLNKTNQLNLRTRRVSEPEMMQWLSEGRGREAMSVTVSDRFGDLGLTGVISWEQVGENVEIVDYVLSCRAMGRKVEELMASLAVQAAREAGARSVIAHLLPTEKNRPCLEFWRSASGFAEPETHRFVWDATKPYPRPEFISLDIKTQARTSIAAE